MYPWIDLTWFATSKSASPKIIQLFLKVWAVAVALWTVRSLPISEDPGLNPVIGNFYWTCLLFVEKTKIKEKRPGMAHLKKTFFSKPSIPTCISRVFLHWNFHLDIQAASENESYAFSFSASGEPVWPRLGDFWKFSLTDFKQQFRNLWGNLKNGTFSLKRCGHNFGQVLEKIGHHLVTLVTGGGELK